MPRVITDCEHCAGVSSNLSTGASVYAPWSTEWGKISTVRTAHSSIVQRQKSQPHAELDIGLDGDDFPRPQTHCRPTRLSCHIGTHVRAFRGKRFLVDCALLGHKRHYGRTRTGGGRAPKPAQPVRPAEPERALSRRHVVVQPQATVDRRPAGRLGQAFIGGARHLSGGTSCARP